MSEKITNDVIKPDSIKSDVIKPDAIKSDAIKSDAIKSDVIKSDAIKPAEAEYVNPLEISLLNEEQLEGLEKVTTFQI